MKKKTALTIVLLCIGVLSYGQSFKYSKVLTMGNTVKMKGSIKVSDTLIAITTNGVPAEFKVNKIADAGWTKQFKVVGIGEDYSMRITLNNPSQPTKEVPKAMILETKDSFTNTNSMLIYYLEDE